jgi:hypothetical protein
VILSGEDVTVAGVVEVTLTVRVTNPVALGLPEITHAPAYKVNPGSGALPLFRAHV